MKRQRYDSDADSSDDGDALAGLCVAAPAAPAPAPAVQDAPAPADPAAADDEVVVLRKDLLAPGTARAAPKKPAGSRWGAPRPAEDPRTQGQAAAPAPAPRTAVAFPLNPQLVACPPRHPAAVMEDFRAKDDSRPAPVAARYRQALARAENRFGIAPGVLWDATVRGNGFEGRLLERKL